MSTWSQSQYLCYGSVCENGKRSSDRESAELSSVYNGPKAHFSEEDVGEWGTQGQESEISKERSRYSQPNILMPITFGVEFGFGIV